MRINIAKSIIEDFNERRASGNSKILSQDAINIKRFFALDNKAYESGEIADKYKEMMGLVASTVLRCNDCILYHIQQCFKLGCTKEELLEALNIALVVGGSIVIPHLRIAVEGMEELGYDI